MRTAEMNYHVTIKYPDNICFVFNPQIVQLSGGLLAGGMSLETYIYEIVDNDTSFKYTDNRVSVSDNISLDLSTYLQSLFDAKSSLPQSKK